MSFNDFMSMEEKLRKAAENDKSEKPAPVAEQNSKPKNNAVKLGQG